MKSSDTIYALSSGASRAGIAVVRLSGPHAAEVVCSLCGALPPNRKAVVRKLRDRSGEIIDEALVIWMPGPESFTGEDIAEFHVHGSAAVVRRLQTAISENQHARPAEAGEFSRRAFANGRMDLLEAEGLSDLLAAQTDAQHRQAMSLVLGEASSRYAAWRGRLLSVLARGEAAIDFIDEADVGSVTLVQLREDVSSLAAELAFVLADGEKAKAIRDGVSVVLAGPPNVGKSSLLNRLAKRDAAIVSEKPGTTRDIIEVVMDVADIPVILTDTAGLRHEGNDEIEREGMARTRARADNAGIVIWVTAPDVEDNQVPIWPDQKIIRVMNKSDLATDNGGDQPLGILRVSAKSGTGIDELLNRLADELRVNYHLQQSSVIVRDRHRVALKRTIRLLNDSQLHDWTQLELVCEELRAAAHELGTITGSVDVEEILGAIFAEFCIGK